MVVLRSAQRCLASQSIRSAAQTRQQLKRTLSFLLPVLILGVFPSLAQVTSSSILGYVYDPSGAVITDASITVFDARHSVIRKTTTDSSGAYIVVGLVPAQYSIAASATDFAEVTQPQVSLEVNSQLRVDFHLPLVATQKTIEVAARVSPLQTESADLATVVNQQQIESLPLNRRDFLQLALLSPGVLPPVEGSELSTRGSFSMHAGGGREEFNNFLLDGVDNNSNAIDFLNCLLYTSPSPRDLSTSRMPSSA